MNGKRVLALLLAAVMLLLAPAVYSESVSDVPEDAAVRIWSVDAQTGTMTYLCSGVMLNETTAAAPDLGFTSEEMLIASAPDGTYAQVTPVSAQDGMAFLTVNGGTSDTWASVTDLAADNGIYQVATMSETMAGRVSGTLTGSVTWGDTACRLLTTDADLTLGALVLDDGSVVMGMVIARWTQGTGTYVVAPVCGVAPAVSAGSVTVEGDPEGWLTDFDLNWDKGILTLDWTNCAMGTVTEDSVIQYYFMDIQNPYYSWGSKPMDQCSVGLPAVAGHTYVVWARCCDASAGQSEPSGDGYILYSVPEADPYTEHDYREISCYVGFLPAGTDEYGTEAAPEAETVTRELLEDETRELFLQVTSAYSVEEDTEANLAVVLDTPDGLSVCLPGGFIFMTSIQEADVWHDSLKQALETCVSMRGSLPSGTYTVTYYLDGVPAGQTGFTLE